MESFAGLSAEKMKELAVALCQTDKGLANGILSQMQQCTEARKAMVQACLQVCNQIMENCKEVESVTVIGYSRTLKALESQLTHEDISEGERESITEKMLSVMDEMKKYDEENKNFYREVLDKLVVGLLACADGSSHDENSSEDEPAGGTD